VQQECKYNVAGLLERLRDVGEETMGYPVLGREEDLPELIEAHALKGAIVAVGDNFVRSKVVARIKEISPDLPFVYAIVMKSIDSFVVAYGAPAKVIRNRKQADNYL
jgi:uncharacterized membrane-anchored protein